MGHPHRMDLPEEFLLQEPVMPGLPVHVDTWKPATGFKCAGGGKK